MTLQELLESALVKDEDRIRLYMTVDSTKKRIATGKWYEDNILKALGHRINAIEMETIEGDTFWLITLDGDDT